MLNTRNLFSSGLLAVTLFASSEARAAITNARIGFFNPGTSASIRVQGSDGAFSSDWPTDITGAPLPQADALFSSATSGSSTLTAYAIYDVQQVNAHTLTGELSTGFELFVGNGDIPQSYTVGGQSRIAVLFEVDQVGLYTLSGELFRNDSPIRPDPRIRPEKGVWNDQFGFFSPQETIYESSFPAPVGVTPFDKEIELQSGLYWIFADVISNGALFNGSIKGDAAVSYTLTAVPEPATLGLLAAVALGLLSRRRRLI